MKAPPTIKRQATAAVTVNGLAPMAIRISAVKSGIR